MSLHSLRVSESASQRIDPFTQLVKRVSYCVTRVTAHPSLVPSSSIIEYFSSPLQRVDRVSFSRTTPYLLLSRVIVSVILCSHTHLESHSSPPFASTESQSPPPFPVRQPSHSSTHESHALIACHRVRLIPSPPPHQPSQSLDYIPSESPVSEFVDSPHPSFLAHRASPPLCRSNHRPTPESHPLLAYHRVRHPLSSTHASLIPSPSRRTSQSVARFSPSASPLIASHRVCHP